VLGHTHAPLAVSQRDGTLLRGGVGTVALPAGDRCLLNPGSVGQSRARRPQARAVVLDLARREAAFLEVDYDSRGNRAALRRAGRPASSSHLSPTLVARVRRRSLRGLGRRLVRMAPSGADPDAVSRTMREEPARPSCVRRERRSRVFPDAGTSREERGHGDREREPPVAGTDPRISPGAGREPSGDRADGARPRHPNLWAPLRGATGREGPVERLVPRPLRSCRRPAGAAAGGRRAGGRACARGRGPARGRGARRRRSRSWRRAPAGRGGAGTATGTGRRPSSATTHRAAGGRAARGLDAGSHTVSCQSAATSSGEGSAPRRRARS
jgi:hypothetical protein